MSESKMVMKWDDIKRRLEGFHVEHPQALAVYGVPRGGAVIAGLLASRYVLKVVETPEEADVIVDDIVDSGKTASRYTKPFWALVNKQRADADIGWVVFPWEEADPLKDNEDIVVRLLQVLGEDPTREGLLETPKRFLKAMREFTSGYGADPAAILGKTFNEPTDQMVVVSGIEYWSTCEHHLLPFNGTVTIAYIPNERVVGLSKLPRLVHAFAKRLQVQERLTKDIAGAIESVLKPKGVGVIVTGSHLCMKARGVKCNGVMTTSDLRGAIRDNALARAEFLSFNKVG